MQIKCPLRKRFCLGLLLKGFTVPRVDGPSASSCAMQSPSAVGWLVNRDKQTYCKKDTKWNERHCRYHTVVKEEKSQARSSKGTHLGNSMPWDAGAWRSHAGFKQGQAQTGTFSYSPLNWVSKNAEHIPHGPCKKPSSFSKDEFDLRAGFPIIILYRNLSSKASGNCHCWRQVLSLKYWESEPIKQCLSANSARACSKYVWTARYL